MKKAIIYLMLVLGVIGLVGCGKDKGETSSSENSNISITVDTVKGNTYDEKVMELLTNQKYWKVVNGSRVSYFYPKYKELVCEIYANRETPKNQAISFYYETEEELNEIIEYAKEFNKTHERMKLSEEPFIEKYQNTVGFGNFFPELDKK